MPYYNLKVMNDNRILSTAAGSVDHALAIFGEELGLRLTLDVRETQPGYLLDEWHEGPHWVDPHIPVFEVPD